MKPLLQSVKDKALARWDGKPFETLEDVRNWWLYAGRLFCSFCNYFQDRHLPSEGEGLCDCPLSDDLAGTEHEDSVQCAKEYWAFYDAIYTQDLAAANTAMRALHERIKALPVEEGG